MLPQYSQALREGATLATANARLARDLRWDYDLERQRAGDAVWPAPDIVPWEAWLRRRWSEAVYEDGAGGRLLLSDAQEQALWERIIRDSPEGQTLVHVRATAKMAAEAWKLAHDWDVPLREAMFAGHPDGEAFLAWADAFRVHCGENSWLPPALLPSELIERGFGASRRLLLAGFDEFTKAEERVLQALASAGWSVETVTQQPFEFVDACCAGLRDATAEIQAAAAWAREKLERNPQARVGIVVRDLAASRDIVERIFDDVLHPGTGMSRADPGRCAFHLSLGPFLADYPLVAAALSILALERPMPLAEAGVLLRSPFLSGGDGERGPRALLDAELRQRGLAEITRETLRRFAARCGCPRLAAALDSMRDAAAALPARQRPGDWSRTFARLLECVGWPGERTLDSVEHQTVERWKRLLSELAALGVVEPQISYQDALSHLRSLARETRFAPENRGAPVQVMGMLEASGASFEHLWVMGLDDTAWPSAASPNPFLPLPLVRAHGVPHSTAERELVYASRLMERLLVSAQEIVCSYALRSGDSELAPSPLIARLPERAAEPARSAIASELREGAPPFEKREDSSGPPIAPGVIERGGTRIFERQAACPFAAFAEHRLGARTLDEVTPGLSALERGRLLHRALELVWSELKSHVGLMGRTSAHLADLVRESARTALEEQTQGRGAESLPRIQALEQQRLERLIVSWLDVEKGRDEFEVVEREKDRTVEVGGVKIKIQVDRVDRVAEGVAIIDYKSRKTSASEWEGDRPDSPQLPLYAVTSKEPVSGVMFAQVVPGEMKFVRPKGDLGEQLTSWKVVLDRLGHEFAAGHAAVAPKQPPKTCRYCGFGALCRVSEAPHELAEEES
jgi:ATP-dependent helicase/nuclease subunit B